VSSKIPADNPERLDDLAVLPGGRHGLPAEFVERNQRERLIAAFLVVVDEVGYGGATITNVKDRAGVATRTFYKYFDSVEDICVGAFEKGLDDLRPQVAAAYRGESEWPQRIRAALAAALAEFAEYPELARLLTAEPFAAGSGLARLHKSAIDELAVYLREGRELREDGEPLPETAERGILGAVNSMVARQLVAGRGEELEELLPDLTQFVLTPYLGAAQARRIAQSQAAA
jgi:AcrR family transcriptional regulator